MTKITTALNHLARRAPTDHEVTVELTQVSSDELRHFLEKIKIGLQVCTTPAQVYRLEQIERCAREVLKNRVCIAS